MPWQFLNGCIHTLLAGECLVGHGHCQVALGGPLLPCHCELAETCSCEALQARLIGRLHVPLSRLASIHTIWASQRIRLSCTLSCLHIWVRLTNKRWLLYRKSLRAHLLLKMRKRPFLSLLFWLLKPLLIIFRHRRQRIIYTVGAHVELVVAGS